MNPWIPFLTALIWPVTTFFLLFIYRDSVSTIIRLLRGRLERGDKFTVAGVTIESPSPGLGVQSVQSLDGSSNQVALILAATKANVRGKVLIATSAGFRGGDPAGLVGAGDALGMAVLQTAFQGAPALKVETAIIPPSYAHLAELIRDNFVIISVGGPGLNQLTRSVMDQVYTTLAFEGLTVFDRATDKRYIPTVDNDTLSGNDWGIILSLPHPQYGPAGRAVILAGCYGFGSQATAMVLTELHNYKELSAIAEHSCFEALIEVPSETWSDRRSQSCPLQRVQCWLPQRRNIAPRS